jgi:hypothetical protein
LLPKLEPFSRKSFLPKGRSGRKVELDEIIDPLLKIPSSAIENDSGAPSIKEEERTHYDDHGELVRQAERRSARIHKSLEWFGNPILSILLVKHEKPTPYTEAMEGPKSEKWLEAMKFDIRSMYDNKVWTLVDMSNDRKTVENKWIFKKNTNADGNVTIYKA